MNNWFAEYAKYSLSVSYNDGSWPEMTVEVPSRNFTKCGIPVGIFEWGDKIGKALWTQTIQFETTREKGDKAFKTSTFSGTQASKNERTSLYYYPSGTQLNGNQLPKGSYATVPKQLKLQTLQNLVTNGTLIYYDDQGKLVTEDNLSIYLGLNVQARPLVEGSPYVPGNTSGLAVYGF